MQRVHLTVGIAQLPTSSSIAVNLDRLLDSLRGSLAGDMIVTPEGSLTGYLEDDGLGELARQTPEQVDRALDVIAREVDRIGVHVWVGACRYAAGDWWNMAYGLSPGGERHEYRKANLATAERELFRAGDELPTFAVAQATVGVQICRELRFPEQWSGWLSLEPSCSCT